MIVPIVFFAFNRPDTTHRVLEALSRQSKAIPRLIAFCDGARHEEEHTQVQQVRNLVRAVTWTEVEIIERERNYGLVENIVGGVDDVFSRYERAIIVEDDILTAPHFYESLCNLLDHYQSAHNVFSVGAYPYLLAEALPDYPYDVIMSARFSVWGWGSWSERWQALAPLIRQFNNPFGQPEHTPNIIGDEIVRMAREIEEIQLQTWAIPVTILCLHRHYLHAVTRYYLSNDIGLNSGVHFSKPPNPHFLRFIAQHNVLESRVPQHLAPAEWNEQVVEAVRTYVNASFRASKYIRFAKLRYYWRRIIYHSQRLCRR